MNKSQFVSVIVRLIGVAFLAHAAFALLNIGSGLVLLAGFPSGNSFTAPFLLDAIVRVLGGLIIGLYLIIDGSLLFSILDRED